MTTDESRCCSKAWRLNEFLLSNFGLSHRNPTLFVSDQWQWPAVIYLVYRAVVAVYFLVWIVLSGAIPYSWAKDDSQRVKWFIYLTNWSFLIFNVHLIVQFFIVLHAYPRIRRVRANVGDHPIDEPMPWYLKLAWVLYNLANVTGILTSIAFWALMYTAGDYVHPVDYNTHAANSIYIVIDMFITATPTRLYHVYHGIIYAIVYIVFSVIYTLAGGMDALLNEYIYNVLDWKEKAGSAVLYSFIVGLLGTPIIWFVLFGLYSIRMAVYRAVYRNNSRLMPKDEVEMGHDGIANAIY